MADIRSDYDTIRFVLSGEKSDLRVVQENIKRQEVKAQDQTDHERYIDTYIYCVHKKYDRYNSVLKRKNNIFSQYVNDVTLTAG